MHPILPSALSWPHTGTLPGQQSRPRHLVWPNSVSQPDARFRFDGILDFLSIDSVAILLRGGVRGLVLKTATNALLTSRQRALPIGSHRIAYPMPYRRIYERSIRPHRLSYSVCCGRVWCSRVFPACWAGRCPRCGLVSLSPIESCLLPSCCHLSC